MTLTALELESDTLGSAELIENLCGDCRTFHEGSSNRGGGTVIDEENLSELDLAIDFAIKLFNIECVALLDAILFAAGLEYCVGHCV